MDATYTRTFAYDDLNRLTTANTGTSLWQTGSYTYDAMGNLVSRSLGKPPVDDGTVLSVPGRHLRASTAVTGQVDRLSFTFQGTTPKISVVTANGLDHTVSYDNTGNETGYYYSARTYSPRNLMNSVTDTSGEGPTHSVTYGYDYRGVRVSRTETPTDAGSTSRYYFYTPELQLLASTVDDSNNVWGQSAHTMSTPLVMNREVIWFNGQPVGEFGPPRTPDATVPLSLHRTFDTNTPSNNLFYTLTDHLGTPLIQTDPTRHRLARRTRALRQRLRDAQRLPHRPAPPLPRPGGRDDMGGIRRELQRLPVVPGGVGAVYAERSDRARSHALRHQEPVRIRRRKSRRSL